ncbi:hypothetical protein M9H77_10245 [Catharanthus roseus]|uniref:Uncharacterized protein n=1 Tax=Catharanthus roseus TaxID=4058 RepID=A0ACC0C2X5_CATRO|nr:hypothetical protein M9H77_10245 [Catharanthus roseus]
MTMRVSSYYEVHHMFYFNLYGMNNNEEMRYLWTIPLHLANTVNNDDDEVDISNGDDVIFSQSESDDNNDPEEGEFQTPLNPVNPVNPVTKNIVPQWERSQWFIGARYDYTYSGAFLDMGSVSPIDDLVESGTVRLLDWNDSMIDI